MPPDDKKTNLAPLRHERLPLGFPLNSPDGGLVSMCNLDGGSLPRSEPQPRPDYREPAIPADHEAYLKQISANSSLDAKLAKNALIQRLGADAVEGGLALAVLKLLRVNRELAIRLYGRPVDLDGIPVHPMWNP